MASGHVSRIKRPNTWLHRPMLQNVKKALANPEPSTHGTFETCRRALCVFRWPTARGPLRSLWTPLLLWPLLCQPKPRRIGAASS